MKGIVFAAGVGSRLKPFTDSHPKALVPVKGRPAIAWVLDRLIAAGADDIVVNVYHFAGQMKEYLSENYPHVNISDESDLLLNQAGGLAKIYRDSSFHTPVRSDDTIVVHNADIFTDMPLDEMVDRHRNTGADATLLIDYARKTNRLFLFDAGNRLHGWVDTGTGVTKPDADIDVQAFKSAAFGGIHVLSGRFLGELSRRLPEIPIPYGITPFYLDNCGAMRIMGFSPEKKYYWFDLGTPEKVTEAEAM